MKAIDVCCGAGGLTLGLQRAGFEVRGFDLDADAIDTHRRHAGPASRVDIRRRLCLDAEEPAPWAPPSADVVAGGVPCQPFSMAGERLGVNDPRYLVPDFLSIARDAGARAVILENVRGLVFDRKAFRIVLDAFEAEWLTTWAVLDAADYGVPQHRDRLFVIGFKDPSARAVFRWSQPTHAPAGGLFGRPYVTAREAIGLAYDAPSPCVTATEHKSAVRGSQPMSRRRRATERLDLGRRLAIAELAAIQAFPASWTLSGDIESQHRQIGNAVPPPLAEAVARSVMTALRAAM